MLGVCRENLRRLRVLILAQLQEEGRRVVRRDE